MTASAWACDIGKVKVRSPRAWDLRLALERRRGVDSAIPSGPVGDDRPRDRRRPRTPSNHHRPRAAAPGTAGTARSGDHAADHRRGRRPVHDRAGHRPARAPRARAAGPPGRHRRPAQRDLPRLAVLQRGRRRRRAPARRRTGWPTTATARASSSRTDRSGRRSTIEDSSRVDPWIVRQAAASRGVVYRAAGRVQPPRPTDVGRLRPPEPRTHVPRSQRPSHRPQEGIPT